MKNNIVQEVRNTLAQAMQEARPAVIEGKTHPHCIRLAGYNNHPMPLGESRSPVQEYADRQGMPEILGGYKRPGDLKFGEIQNYVMVQENEMARGNITPQQYCDKIDNLWDALKDENPSLKNIQIKENKNLLGRFKDRSDINQKKKAIIGVDDGYNVSDIQFFLDKFSDTKSALNMTGGKTAESRAYMNLSAQAQEKTEGFRWRPSPDTLNFIQDKKMGRNPDTAPMHGGVERKSSVTAAYARRPDNGSGRKL
ncbi:MAG: hypothetical protein EA357_04725 [Micavibrio sp.]|nr:MAG: hypothetical protein EA357_04725 [Micavibrio sp.]